MICKFLWRISLWIDLLSCLKISVQLEFRKSAREEAKGSLWVLIPVFFMHLGFLLLFSRPVVSDSVTLWAAACQASLSLTMSRVYPSSCSFHWWCRPTNSSSVALFSFCPVFPSIRDFSTKLAVHIRWPKYWSFSFSVSLSSEYSELISLKIDWFDHLAVQGTFRSLSSTTVQRHQFFDVLPPL